MKRLLSRAWTWTKRLLALGGVAAVVAAGWGAVAYKQHVLDDPGEHIALDHIQAIIAQESPVLYRDGETPIGVFFSQEHRQYVPYERIPQAWVDAITAAEDQRFFEHPGFDWRGISRAMIDNIEAGRVVAGGSTLTQQTAKNLYYRPDRSFRSKWEELVNALRLEAHHDKEDILEFYANQFHVSANGRGLGIAARYFFDKEVEDLTTLESAYIAGMVKAPATYNPFIGSTAERRDAALLRAHERTRYVLDRMLATGRLDEATHARLVAEEIPFRKGTFRYDTHVILDEVSQRLEQAPFPALFEELGIDNPGTAGIQVVTTIDEHAQRGATWALWHHLTEVGPLLEAPALADARGLDDPRAAVAAAFRLPDDRAPSHDPHDPLLRWEFSPARVTAVELEPDPRLHLDIGGHPCVVDGDALDRAATIVARATKGETWRRPADVDRQAVLDALPAGSVAWASVKTPALTATDGPDAAPALCDLELRPELQGAVIVLEDGRIRAMVGGNDNRNFNRATTARRQLGSTWKPVLYFAALQLGWLPTDRLDNRPDQVFHFEGTWYYPRPDHQSEDTVSLAWAGTRSENLASIWLLSRLTDRLDEDQFADLARRVDMVPRRGEGRRAWIERIRDEHGVISTEARLPEVAFHAVRDAVAEELAEEGRADEAWEVGALHYGSGADAELARLRGQRGVAGKTRAVQRNLLHLEARAEACRVQAERLEAYMDAMDRASTVDELTGGRLGAATDRLRPDPLSPDDVADLRLRPRGGTLQLGCGDVGEGWARVGEHLLAAVAAGVRIPLGEPGDMLVEGTLHKDVLDRLRRETDRRRLVLEQADPWTLEVLRHHPDYRQLVGMRYLARVAATFGVQEELPPVLSMPLGAVDISVEEAASLYQGMLRGETWAFPGQLSLPSATGGWRTEDAPALDATTVLIAEIRDRDGNLLYRALPESTAVTDPAAGRMSGDILRNVVRWGTGRRALDTITLGGRPVPVAGKTGTTNAYRNAAFVGFVPRAVPAADGPRWEWGTGFTVAAYVGYDDNRSMRRGGVRLQGASGSLPAWIGTAQVLADTGLLGDAAPAEGEWLVEEDYVEVPVLQGSGLPAEVGGDEALVAGTEAELSGGRTVVVAHSSGILGIGAGERRIVAPVPGVTAGGEAVAPGTAEAAPEPAGDVPVLPPDGELPPEAELPPDGELPPDAELPPDGELPPDADPAEAAPAEAAPAEAAPAVDRGADAGADPAGEGTEEDPEEDPVEAWLGEYLDEERARAGGEEGAPGGPGPTERQAPGPDAPTADPDTGIAPRIAPSP